MGDHGNRIGAIQTSFVGRIEERTPFFGLFLPEKFRQKYSKYYENLKLNSNRFVSL